MTIKENYRDESGTEYTLEYSDADSFDDLEYARCTQTYGACFCDNKLVIGLRGKKKKWGLIGGTIEKGESFEETLRREIKEESNMEILKFLPIGYQKSTDERRHNDSFYQLRYACTVRPYGPFIADVDESIVAIKLIDPRDYKKYFDWGQIGERIISRAVELLPKL